MSTKKNHAPDDDTPPVTPGLYVTVDFVEELFGVTRKTVESWLLSGELVHYRLGPRTIRILRTDLEDFIAGRRRTTLYEKEAATGEAAKAQVAENVRSKQSAGDPGLSEPAPTERAA